MTSNPPRPEDTVTMTVDEALKLFEEAASPSPWRSIESAPKDGTVIDVWLGDAEPAEIDFYCSTGTRRSAGWAFRQGRFRPAVGLHVIPTMVEPTHWMPLPPPPVSSVPSEER